MKEYWIKIYKTRYFWSHLARCELKSRFRRSKLGLLWTVLQPLFLTMIMAFVFSTVFHQPLGEYAVYILSGMVVWNLINAGIVAGGSSILSAEQYIRQFNHPITIYSLRSAVLNIVTFLIELIALSIWVLLSNPIHLLIGIFCLPLTLVIYFVLSWSCNTIAGFLNCKYRDYPQIMALCMQALWYMSPVMFQKQVFESNEKLYLLYEWNPITHVLNLVRKPMLYGQLPGVADYLFTLFLAGLCVIWAYWVNKKNEKNVIFYL